MPSRRAVVVASVDPKLRQADGKSLVTQELSICEPNGCASQSADGSFLVVISFRARAQDPVLHLSSDFHRAAGSGIGSFSQILTCARVTIAQERLKLHSFRNRLFTPDV